MFFPLSPPPPHIKHSWHFISLSLPHLRMLIYTPDTRTHFHVILNKYIYYYIGSSGSNYSHVRLTKTRCIQCFFLNKPTLNVKKKIAFGRPGGALQLFKGVWNLVAGRSHHKEVMCMTRNHSIILYKLAKRWIHLYVWLCWGPWGYFYYLKGVQYFVAGMSHNKQLETSYIQDNNKIHTHVFHK